MLIVEYDPKRRVLPRVGELAVCGVPKALPLPEILLTPECLCFSLSPAKCEPLLSEPQRLEGISKHFHSHSLREILVLLAFPTPLPYTHTRVEAQRTRSWSSSSKPVVVEETRDPALGPFSPDVGLLLPSSGSTGPPWRRSECGGGGVLSPACRCKKCGKSPSFGSLSSPPRCMHVHPKSLWRLRPILRELSHLKSLPSPEPSLSTQPVLWEESRVLL